MVKTDSNKKVSSTTADLIGTYIVNETDDQKCS